ncbi:hypothetical protein MUO32_26415 [Shinella sp. CPCC 101442]|uniref:hypothetical protein n=1 Tax=Shinella sp. CPCC 101442 TaxID=2932265 RepID=UPI00215376C5|nr:hypothetical protein [Shinella sp. CPCC 101442]MCR6502565.1 hypothetical protein [Shinella sp. CPCC 101442]
MTEVDLLKEEIKEQEQEIFRLRNSMNRADNGVKRKRIETLSRTLGRLKAEVAALENRRASA